MKNMKPQITLMCADYKKDRFSGRPGRAMRVRSQDENPKRRIDSGLQMKSIICANLCHPWFAFDDG